MHTFSNEYVESGMMLNRAEAEYSMQLWISIYRKLYYISYYTTNYTTLIHYITNYTTKL